MFYRRFTIEKFKGICKKPLSISCDGDRPVVTLVGLNESGKTTILEAVSHLKDGVQNLETLYRERPREFEPTDLIPLNRRANFNDIITITADLELTSEDIIKICKFAKESHDITLDRSALSNKFSLSKRLAFEASKYSGTLNHWTIGLEGKKGRERKNRQLYGQDRKAWLAIVKYIGSMLPTIAYFPTFLFEMPERIHLNPGEQEDALNRHYREVIQDILDALHDGLDVGKHIVERALSDEKLAKSEKRALDQVLKLMGRKVAQVVFERWDQILGHRSVSRDILFEIEVSSNKEVFLTFKLEDGDSVFFVSERSLGFRWFFSFLLFTQFRVYRQKHFGVLFLFDEPASNLHPKAQQQLLHSFEMIANGGASIIYSTHSHHLIEPRWLERAYIVENLALNYDDLAEDAQYVAKNTNIVAHRYRAFAGQYPNRTTYFQPILDALDYRPSMIEAIPRAVLVEGKNDYYVVSAMWGKNDPPIVPGTGAGALDAAISLFLDWARPFVILLDDDKEGRSARERYRRDWNLAESMVVTYGDLDPALTGARLESLFEPADRDELARRYYPGSTTTLTKKSICQEAMQEEAASPAERRLQMSPGTVERFERIRISVLQRLDALGTGVAACP